MSKFRSGDMVCYWDGCDSNIYEVTKFDPFGWILMITDNGFINTEKPPFSELRHATKKEAKLKKRLWK